MSTLWERTARSAPLVQAARRSGIPFEASPTGRWVRIAGQRSVVYVVQDAWGDGCLVMGFGDEEKRHVEHYLSPEMAIGAAVEHTGAAAKWQREKLAEAG